MWEQWEKVWGGVGGGYIDGLALLAAWEPQAYTSGGRDLSKTPEQSLVGAGAQTPAPLLTRGNQ